MDIFPNPIPQGHPTCNMLLAAPGRYFKMSLPDGCYFAFAATIPLPTARQGCLLPDTVLLVGMSQGPLVVCNGRVGEFRILCYRCQG